MIKQTAGALILGLAASGAAYAAPESDSIEMRGYTNCQTAIETELGTDRVAWARQYLTERAGSERVFYVNATAFANGEATAFASECVTTLNGTEVAEVDVREGRYVSQPGRVLIDIAAR